MSLTFTILALSLVFMLITVGIALLLLVLLWRLLAHGSVRPPGPTGAGPSAVLTGVYLGVSVVVGPILLSISAPLVMSSGGELSSALPWVWGTLVLVVPTLGAAILASSRTARRSGSIRSASLDVREPVLTRWAWARIWAGTVATGLVALVLGVVMPRLPLPRTTLGDGSSAAVVGLQPPAGWDLVLGLVATAVVSALGSVAAFLITRRPAPETGWDPRSALVNWCCAMCCLSGGAWSVGPLVRSALSGGGDTPSVTAMSTGLQVAAALVGVGLLFCLLPRRVFVREPVRV